MERYFLHAQPSKQKKEQQIIASPGTTTGEVYDGNTLCFIEVKTRASDWFAPPQVNVDLRKRRQVTRAARVYRQMLGIEDEPHRYDIVTVVIGDAATPQIELLRNFWTEESLRKRRWSTNFYD